MNESQDSADHKDLSPAEWKVMKIVWDLQKGVTREIYSVAGEENDWSVATVKTLLKRLVDKGYLSTTKIGNGFVYRPAKSAIAVLRLAANTLLENTTRAATGPLLAHMVESSPLEVDELDALQKLIDEKKKSLAKQSARDKKRVK